jgi:putative ABC transport system permease protein
MQKVALIGTYVAQQVFGETDPVGQKMKINGQIFKVVGVLAQKDGGEKSSGDDVVIIPYTVAQRLSKSARITSYLVGASSATDVDKATTSLKTYLAKIFTDDTRGYSVRSQEQMLSTLSDVTGSMMVILGGIAAISLVVGGIGIMNIMLVSVTERTREIGIRKAIGAKRRSILIQFLIESAVVTGIGGILGVLIGVSIIYFIIGGFNITTPVYSTFWMILSFGISLAVGVVFGMFPAYKAARLNPIEALRSE